MFITHRQTLNLSRLSLERVKPSAFKHLSSLEVLDLSYNKLYHLHSSTVEYLPKLKQIWLAGEYRSSATFELFFFGDQTCNESIVFRKLVDLQKRFILVTKRFKRFVDFQSDGLQSYGLWGIPAPRKTRCSYIAAIKRASR